MADTRQVPSLPRRAPGIVLEADRLLTPLYGLGVVGAFLQVAGANWDVSSHILGIVDSFFTPSHLVLYLGILLVLIAGFLGVWFERHTDAKLRPFFTGFRVASVCLSNQTPRNPAIRTRRIP